MVIKAEIGECGKGRSRRNAQRAASFAVARTRERRTGEFGSEGGLRLLWYLKTKGRPLGILDRAVGEEAKANNHEVKRAGFHLLKAAGDRAIWERRSEGLQKGDEQTVKVCDAHEIVINQRMRGQEKRKSRVMGTRVWVG